MMETLADDGWEKARILTEFNGALFFRAAWLAQAA
jgi:hypothetical protein